VTRIRTSGSSSQIEDRRGSGGGLFGGLGGGIPLPGKLGGGLVGIIVTLAIVLLPRLMSGSGTNSAVDTGSTSGEACDTETAQIICGGTEDVQAFWQDELPTAFGKQYQVTKTVFFTQATSTGCGQASSQTGPFYCPADAKVYFDLDFLVQLQNEFGAQGDLASQYIVAHEYGHHIQNLLGTNADVQRLSQQNPDKANEYSVALELQADCYAGVWASNANDRGLLESPSEINEALNAAAAVGDDRIQQQTQGRIDPESFTHGTSEQRVSWFRRGFDTKDPTRCTTFEEVLG
jgi:predicted metalloprotease